MEQNSVKYNSRDNRAIRIFQRIINRSVAPVRWGPIKYEGSVANYRLSAAVKSCLCMVHLSMHSLRQHQLLLKSHDAVKYHGDEYFFIFTATPMSSLAVCIVLNILFNSHCINDNRNFPNSKLGAWVKIQFSWEKRSKLTNFTAVSLLSPVHFGWCINDPVVSAACEDQM